MKQPRKAAPVEKPINGLLDPRFVYVPSEKTNVELTFARERARQAASKGKPL